MANKRLPICVLFGLGVTMRLTVPWMNIWRRDILRTLNSVVNVSNREYPCVLSPTTPAVAPALPSRAFSATYQELYYLPARLEADQQDVGCFEGYRGRICLLGEFSLLIRLSN